MSDLTQTKNKNESRRGVIQLETILASANDTSAEFYVSLYQDICESINSFTLLSDEMDKATEQATPTSHIMQSLVTAKSAIKHLAGDLVLEKENHSIENTATSDTSDKTYNLAKPSHLDTQLNDRDKALAELADVARYFRKAEPHSPISYAIEQVIRWSKLSLPELLTELISNDEARNGYFKLSGIKASDNNN